MNKRKCIILPVVFILAFLAVEGSSNSENEDVFISKFDNKGSGQWTQLLGTPSLDSGSGIALDAKGDLYITGGTCGDLDINKNTGFYDMFVAKYDSSGNRLWTEVLGTPDWDSGSGITVDEKGNAYVVGSTLGNLDGNSNEGYYDIFIAKYNSAGSKQWTVLLGTGNSDEGEAITADRKGNIYVAGVTSENPDGKGNAESTDIIAAKYDTDGNGLWEVNFGTSADDWAKGIALDSIGNLYVTGATFGDLGGKKNAGEGDMFITKCDTRGNRLWTELLGTSGLEWGAGIAVDNNDDVYVTGGTGGNLGGRLNNGGSDIFLAKYDTDGNRLWTELLGTSAVDMGRSVAVDAQNNVYITGGARGNPDTDENSGYFDYFMAKYDSGGNKLWLEIYGSSSFDLGEGITVGADTDGSVYVTGETRGGLDRDVFEKK